jgi:uncharacterized protein
MAFLDDAVWFNPPPAHGRDDDGHWLDTGHETDFWRHTHYGFVHDNGHALMAPVEGDFTAVVAFSAAYKDTFDQAGVMLRLDDTNWIKAGVELSDGVLNLGAVVTRHRSDWSNTPMPNLTGPQRLRFTRRKDAVAIEFDDRSVWRLLRLADFPEGPARFGVMACSPSRAGLRARFHTVTVGPAEDVVHATGG